jgi:hypothetical protein
MTADPEERGTDRPALGADLVIPLLAAAFTIYFLVSTASLTWEAKANGVVIGTVLLVLIAMQVVRIGVRVLSRDATLGLGEFGRRSPVQAKRLALVGLLALFVAVVPWLGTTLSLLLVMAASMWILGVRTPRTLVVVPILTAAAVYVLFIAFLETRLPHGVIENLISTLTGTSG